jgi:hypothetical protein
MAATRDIISKWFDHGLETGASHMFIICDCFDYSDYPVYVNYH